ncbi:MAG: DUF6279 family lipoprotein [Rhodoferax sp.]
MSFSKPHGPIAATPRSGRWLSIIGTMLLCGPLAACSALRLGYDSAPSLAYWWLDGYFDFSPAQATLVRKQLQATQDWHRSQELPLLARQIADLQAQATQAASAEQLCDAASALQTRFNRLVLQLAPALAELAPTLQPAQLQHIDRAWSKRDAQWHKDTLEGLAAERVALRSQRMAERLESFYGPLRQPQLELLRVQAQAAAADAVTVHGERLRRHQDSLAALAALRELPPGSAQALAAARALLERALVSPDSTYQQYLARALRQGCADLAALHNSMQPAQRAHLADTLQHYAQDLTELAQP